MDLQFLSEIKGKVLAAAAFWSFKGQFRGF
jgi:hypothetical protein